MRKWERILWVFVLTVVLSSPTPWTGSEDRAFAQGRAVRIAWTAVTGAQAPIWIAKEKNLYKKYGLETEIVYVAGSPTATKAMLAGDLDLTVNSGNSVVQAAAAGQDVVVLAGIVNVPVYSLMSKTPLKPSDLKGKVIATDKPGSHPYNSLLLALRHMNLDPRDVKINPIGPPVTVLSAMELGVVDVGLMSPPVLFKAESLGFHTVVDIAALGISNQGSSITATRRFIRGHREEVLKFMKALVEAIHVYKTDPESSFRVLDKYTKVQDREILEKTRRYFADKIIAQVPYPTLEGLKTDVELQSAANPRMSSVNVDQLVDTSFLAELERSGFVRDLYR